MQKNQGSVLLLVLLTITTITGLGLTTLCILLELYTSTVERAHHMEYYYQALLLHQYAKEHLMQAIENFSKKEPQQLFDGSLIIENQPLLWATLWCEWQDPLWQITATLYNEHHIQQYQSKSYFSSLN